MKRGAAIPSYPLLSFRSFLPEQSPRPRGQLAVKVCILRAEVRFVDLRKREPGHSRVLAGAGGKRRSLVRNKKVGCRKVQMRAHPSAVLHMRVHMQHIKRCNVRGKRA